MARRSADHHIRVREPLNFLNRLGRQLGLGEVLGVVRGRARIRLDGEDRLEPLAVHETARHGSAACEQIDQPVLAHAPKVPRPPAASREARDVGATASSLAAPTPTQTALAQGLDTSAPEGSSSPVSRDRSPGSERLAGRRASSSCAKPASSRSSRDGRASYSLERGRGAARPSALRCHWHSPRRKETMRAIVLMASW